MTDWSTWVQKYGETSVSQRYKEVVQGNLHFGHIIYCPPLETQTEFYQRITDQITAEVKDAQVYECYKAPHGPSYVYFDANTELQNRNHITRLEVDGEYETPEEGQLRVIRQAEATAERLLAPDSYCQFFGHYLIYHLLHGRHPFQEVLFKLRYPGLPLFRDTKKYKSMWNILLAAIFYGMPPSICEAEIAKRFPNELQVAMIMFSPVVDFGYRDCPQTP